MDNHCSDCAWHKARYQEDINELSQALKQAIEFIDELEWSSGEVGYQTCPCCDTAYEWNPRLQKPHQDDCELVEILRKLRLLI